jgi:hypothetical protein
MSTDTPSASGPDYSAWNGDSSAAAISEELPKFVAPSLALTLCCTMVGLLFYMR